VTLPNVNRLSTADPLENRSGRYGPGAGGGIGSVPAAASVRARAAVSATAKAAESAAVYIRSAAESGAGLAREKDPASYSERSPQGPKHQGHGLLAIDSHTRRQSF